MRASPLEWKPPPVAVFSSSIGSRGGRAAAGIARARANSIDKNHFMIQSVATQRVDIKFASSRMRSGLSLLANPDSLAVLAGRSNHEYTMPPRCRTEEIRD